MTLALFLVLLVTCCGYALLRGGAPERVAGGLFILAYVVDAAIHRLVDGVGYRSPAFGSLVLDALLLVALTVLAWRSVRFWPLWVGGWQICAVAGHLARLLNPGMVPAGYAVTTQLWGYPMVAAIGVATWRYQSRRRHGPVRSWKVMRA